MRSRGGRTSRSAIIIRVLVLVFIISMALACLWNSATGTRFWSPVEIAVASLLIVAVYGGFTWLVTNVGMRLSFRNDPTFERYVQSGGDPYFDVLPKPLNPDSLVTRQTGLQEPEISKSMPKSWIYQCPVCGCRQPSQVCVCWNPECRYGEDGDSTAYFERWGNDADS